MMSKKKDFKQNSWHFKSFKLTLNSVGIKGDMLLTFGTNPVFE